MCRIIKYKVSIKNNQKKMDEEHVRNLALVKELERIKDECKVLRFEKGFLRKHRIDFISKASRAGQMWLRFTDRVIFAWGIESMQPSMRVTAACLP